VLNDEELAERHALIAESPGLQRLLTRLEERARPLLERQPFIPSVKALLSVDGGVCAADGTALEFDPWSPDAHRCPACGTVFTGERYHRWWARLQHLWLGERIAHLAALSTLGDNARAGAESRRLLVEYGSRYLDYPNQDNVLGPSRLFFSTYLESIWVTNIVSAALLLRSAGQLDQAASDAVDLIANEAANLIGDYNEGMSNRQTWNSAALAGLAVWFEDEELLVSTVQSNTGLTAHLMLGFGPDGMWTEGENYHLFALRGFLLGHRFAQSAGLDILGHPDCAARLAAALRAPVLTALPDLTFPARKDSRFGASLAQPMYLENWEAGFAALGNEGQLAGWLGTLYAAPAPRAMQLESYLQEAGLPAPERRGREDLSWWMLALALPDVAPATPLALGSTLLEYQGLAVLRNGDRYASLECGPLGGGHGHPDRLHLTLHQDGVHWLPDPGTGSYVSRDLFWYRSTLAHNAPRIDGVSQTPGDATCEYFDVQGEWSRVRGRFGDITRTLVSGPDHLLDTVEMSSEEIHTLELPWHLAGEWEIVTPGTWTPGTLEDEFITDVEKFTAAAAGPIHIKSISGDATLVLTMLGADELLRATAPGVPGAPPAPFLVARATGRSVRIASDLSSAFGSSAVVSSAFGSSAFGSSAPGSSAFGSSAPGSSGSDAHAVAVTVLQDPDDVTTTRAEPMLLDREDQYRRSEEPWPGDESFTAKCWAAWNGDGLYLSIEVTKPDVWFRPPDAPPLLLDNEPDDINSDGVQVYVRPLTDGPVFGFLIVPEADEALRVSGTSGTSGTPEMLDGRWERTEGGYRMHLAVAPTGWEDVRPGDSIGFDLIVNEMRPGRQRRAGQLVWSGDGGWVWLQGDRHDPARFGHLELGSQ
jgi:hypothetical protein